MASTLSSPAESEIDAIKGSRFLGLATPVATEDDAKAVVARRRAAMPEATHHCAAWRLATPRIERASDDGEPSGSAGRPILAQLAGRDLLDVVVVVTRFYGGTKLGVGGLVRAYGAAAAAVLERSTLVPHLELTDAELRYDYADGPHVERVLAVLAIDPGDATFGERVCRRISIPLNSRDELDAALRDATAGRVAICDV